MLTSQDSIYGTKWRKGSIHICVVHATLILPLNVQNNTVDNGVIESTGGRSTISIKRSVFESNSVSCNDVSFRLKNALLRQAGLTTHVDISYAYDCWVLRLRDGEGLIQDSCFVKNDYFSAAIYVREGNYLFSGLFGDNNPIVAPTCLDLLLENTCEEFDSDICLVPDRPGSPAKVVSLMPCVIVMITGAFISLVWKKKCLITRYSMALLLYL